MSAHESREGIYLDYNATTPVCREARAAMEPFFLGGYGNPSSGYPLGADAKKALVRAREDTARALGASPEEIVFTSCGSESNNLAVKGAALSAPPGRKRVVVSEVEHPSVTNAALFLMELGFAVSFAPVDRRGVLDLDRLAGTVGNDCALVSVMHANNETGVVQPVAEAARIARKHGALFHVDAAQSTGKVPVDAGALGADLLTVVGHKVYAPKGVAALYVRAGTKLTPLLHGGGQEGGLRSGTENVAFASALAAALTAAREKLAYDAPRLSRLRDLLVSALRAEFPDLVLHGEGAERLPNTAFVSFPGVWADALLSRAAGLYASTGAACHHGAGKISHVLSAMGVDKEVARGTVRLSLGRFTTEEECRRAAAILIAARRSL
ncbi:MAG: cysteine desulfurase family protein [Thermodesulfobacteriota bacterium]